jgi:hypothetical protein
MKPIFLALLVLASLPADAKVTREKKAEKPVLVADAYYWVGPEGNLAVEISGKFQSEDGLRDTLSLTKEIGRFKDRKYPFNEKSWTLRDILISIDFNSGGSVATWRISGPKPLLSDYVETLIGQYESKSLFYDFSYRAIKVKVSTD